MSHTIAKFGGTSVGCQEGIQSLVNIVQANPSIKIIVVSALAGITNLLERCTQLPSKDQAAAVSIFESIELIHLELYKNLKINPQAISAQFPSFPRLITQLKANLSQSHYATWMGQGEYLSTSLIGNALVQAGLPIQTVDARNLIKTEFPPNDTTPTPHLIHEQTKQHLTPLLNAGNIILTQGYIASTSNGLHTTLGRGGSDYTASLLAQATQAQELILYTDTNGIFSADPHHHPHAEHLQEITQEALQTQLNSPTPLLHPQTLTPLVDSPINCSIRSTFDPSGPFTSVLSSATTPLFK